MYLYVNYVMMILCWFVSGYVGLMINVLENSVLLLGVVLYNSYYYVFDLFVNLLIDCVVMVDELFGVGVWCNSVMYVEFLKLFDVGYLMGVDLCMYDGVECCFCVCCLYCDYVFLVIDKVVCNVLLLYLKCVVWLYVKFGMVEFECMLYVSMIDCMFVGIVIFDECGVIMKINFVVDEIFVECDGLCVCGGVFEVLYLLEDCKL